MSNVENRSEAKNPTGGYRLADTKLEVVVVPVSDFGRAKDFYEALGWRVDADVALEEIRLVQMTPPGSACSIQFGTDLTSAAPGSARGLYLVVSDIETARAQLVARGAEVSEVFHEAVPGARFEPIGATNRIPGAAAEHQTYGSFASFDDPDGNGWLLQEITTRLPGRVQQETTSFSSVADLSAALRRAEAAHGEHEARTGQADPNWPDWYADYMIHEQAGAASRRERRSRRPDGRHHRWQRRHRPGDRPSCPRGRSGGDPCGPQCRAPPTRCS